MLLPEEKKMDDLKNRQKKKMHGCNFETKKDRAILRTFFESSLPENIYQVVKSVRKR